jgi:hypothetical protein
MNAVSNIVAYGNLVGDVAMARLAGMDDMPFEERAEQLAKRGLATFIPYYGKYLAAKWADENDMRLGAGGKWSEGFNNEMEGLMSAAFGVETKDRESYFAARLRYGKLGKKEQNQEVDKIADQYWKDLIANATKFRSEANSPDVHDALLQQWVWDRSLLFSALPREDAERINFIVAQRMAEVAAGQGDAAETEFVRSLAKKLENGGLGSNALEVANYMRHLPFVKDDPERV